MLLYKNKILSFLLPLEVAFNNDLNRFVFFVHFLYLGLVKELIFKHSFFLVFCVEDEVTEFGGFVSAVTDIETPYFVFVCFENSKVFYFEIDCVHVSRFPLENILAFPYLKYVFHVHREPKVLWFAFIQGHFILLLIKPNRSMISKHILLSSKKPLSEILMHNINRINHKTVKHEKSWMHLLCDRDFIGFFVLNQNVVLNELSVIKVYDFQIILKIDSLRVILS